MTMLLIFCCGIVSFFFKGIESGLLSLDPVRLREKGHRSEEQQAGREGGGSFHGVHENRFS